MGRGLLDLTPINGACECRDLMDETIDGQCVAPSVSYIYPLVSTIFLIIAMVLIVFITCTKGMRFFFYRLLEDFQEISLIVFINLHYPQQLHNFLAKLYWFNFTSVAKLFESMAQSTIFVFSANDVLSAKYQTSQNKFRSMMKSTNFLSNSFNILLLWGGLAAIMALIRFIKNRFNEDKEGKTFKIFNKLYNMSFYGLFIQLFYFSLTELGLNTAIQISNMNISTVFSVFGLIFCGLAIAFTFLALSYFLREYKEQALLKEKYRDQSYSSFWLLINDNKFIAKYYWFFSAVKKFIVPFLFVCMQNTPHRVITAVAITQAIWLILTVYAEPYQRKYLRLSLYTSETLKLLVYVALTNFSEKYVDYLPIVPVTDMIYLLLMLMFVNHVVFMIGHLIV